MAQSKAPRAALLLTQFQQQFNLTEDRRPTADGMLGVTCFDHANGHKTGLPTGGDIRHRNSGMHQYAVPRHEHSAVFGSQRALKTVEISLSSSSALHFDGDIPWLPRRSMS
jgi:hypothetical protein